MTFGNPSVRRAKHQSPVEIDGSQPKGGEMNQQLVGNVPALLPKQTARTFQVDCVPEDDCSHYQIESAGSVASMCSAQSP